MIGTVHHSDATKAMPNYLLESTLVINKNINQQDCRGIYCKCRNYIREFTHILKESFVLALLWI